MTKDEEINGLLTENSFLRNQNLIIQTKYNELEKNFKSLQNSIKDQLKNKPKPTLARRIKRKIKKILKL